MPASHQLIARYTKRVEILAFDEASKQVTTIDSTDEGSFRVAVYNHDGSKLALGDNDGLAVLLLDAEGRGLSLSRAQVDKSTILDVDFSPASTYISVLSPFDPNKSPMNMRIFRLSDGHVVFEACRRNLQTWRPQWANDESYACFYSQGSLSLIDPRSDNAHDSKTERPSVRLQNLRAFSVSPGSGQHIVTFCGQVKQQPCVIGIYHKNELAQTLMEHSICQIDEAEFKWNRAGVVLLVNCQDLRTTDKSYYGCSKLFLLDTSSRNKILVTFADDNISLSVADFCWSPVADEFCVVFDRSLAALYSGSGQRLKTFSSRHSARNGVIYHDSGAFIALTGSGNVKGNFEVWHRPPQSKPKHIRPVSDQIEVPYPTMFRWSPRTCYYLLAATTFPRLRQDNCFRIFNLIGQTLFHLEAGVNHLCDVSWRPDNSGDADLSMLTAMLAELKVTKAEIVDSSSRRERYVPPHLRGDNPSKPEPTLPPSKPSRPAKKAVSSEEQTESPKQGKRVGQVRIAKRPVNSLQSWRRMEPTRGDSPASKGSGDQTDTGEDVHEEP